MVLSLSDDFNESCLVWECRDLEDAFGTNHTSQILKECRGDMKLIKATIRKVDKEQILAKCCEKAPPIVDVAKSVGWSRLWDLTPNLGMKAVIGLQMLSRSMGHHGKGDNTCARMVNLFRE